MQFDFDTFYPDLDIAILGVNAFGLEDGNAWFTSVSDLPWLQDVDSNGNGKSDVWEDWQVTYRDVIILDADNVRVGTFHLTDHNLQLFENYDTLRRMFVDAATVNPLPGDYNGNGLVEQADLDLVLLNWGEVLVNPGGSGWIRDLPLGTIDQEELDGVLLNWGNSAASLVQAAVPEPGTLALVGLTILSSIFWRVCRARHR